MLSAGISSSVQDWDPVFNQFGALPFIYGTLVTSALGMFFAVPLGLGAAIFLAELAPRRISDALTFLIDLLAAVPSVIYGLLGVFILVPLMRTDGRAVAQAHARFLASVSGAGLRHRLPDGGPGAGHHDCAVHHFGFARSAAGGAQRPAGSRRWAWARRAGKPPGRPWCLTHAPASWVRFFWLWRAPWAKPWQSPWWSETIPRIAASLLGPGYSIASVLANEFSEATGTLYLSALIELGLVLFLLTFIINGLARLLIVFTTQRGSGMAQDERRD